jgi:uncharacterized repeat protein (TIGR03803 family)
MNSGKPHTIGKNRCPVECAPGKGTLRLARAASHRCLAIALLFTMFIASGRLAQGQTLTVLHGFGGADGSSPEASLIRDTQGNLYGTTTGGGAHNYGTVFMLSPSGAERVIYNFTGGVDGGEPYSSLIRDAQGNLYGTTEVGGAYGIGTVFAVTRAGVETVLHSFTGPDGGYPIAGLIQDAQGNFYGTTDGGGANNKGTVFKLTPSGTETVLYSFTGGADGWNPYSGLVQDANGTLYGTTVYGGANGDGTVYKVTLSGVETVLYNFNGGACGSHPNGGVVLDAQGNLYGTTLIGSIGWGAVFEIFPSSGICRVFHAFNPTGGDGGSPYAGLVQDSNGNLFGTTYIGGSNNWGTVFMVTPPLGIYRVLYSFTGGADGARPVGGLVRDTVGNLYGTTLWYGTNGGGTAFRLSP